MTSPLRTKERSAGIEVRVTALTAGRARVPMMTGWTNSTATWWACSGGVGAQHHSVAPAGEASRQGQCRPGQVVLQAHAEGPPSLCRTSVCHGPSLAVRNAAPRGGGL